jgi:hypothetical protein
MNTQYIKVPEVDKVFTQDVISSMEEFDIDTITPVTISGKVYRLSDVKKLIAVDPNAFATNIQNLTEKKAADVLTAQENVQKIDTDGQAAIDAETAEMKTFFSTFPELDVIASSQASNASADQSTQ